MKLANKKKGFVLIFVLLILLPVLFFCGVIIEIALMDFKSNVNITGKQQAYNNAEAGLLDAASRLDTMDFSKNITQTYYLSFSTGSVICEALPSNHNDNVKVSIRAYLYLNPIEYSITATGNYKGFVIPLNTKYRRNKSVTILDKEVQNGLKEYALY